MLYTAAYTGKARKVCFVLNLSARQSEAKCLESNFVFVHRSELQSNLYHRIRLDRRRFEAAHLRYAILNTASCYPDLLSGPLAMTTDVSDVLQKISPTYYEAFTQRYCCMCPDMIVVYSALLCLISSLQLQHTRARFQGARMC